ncbi:MAG: glutamate--tRNA ligase [Alphaproteobacteria bacterium]
MLRFAPSPTGFLHIGNARVAVLNYLYSKKNDLDFFLRIDDTDNTRSEEKYVDSIYKDLEWLGIKYSKVVRQSSRSEKYKDVFNHLKNKELIYPCFETQEELAIKRKVQLNQGKPPIYDRASLNLNKNEISNLISKGKQPHWRLRLDERSISWNDEIHGEIKFDNLSISDPVLFRSDDMPLFTITSVVDDIDFKVTNILRGDDHITNTAAQIKLFEYLGGQIPKFGHFPLMRSKTGAGLSKRFNSFSINELGKKKIFPIVLLNYLTKIGSSVSIENIDDLEKLKTDFQINHFSKNSVLFDEDDLDRMNSKYLKDLPFDVLKKNFDIDCDKKFWEIIKKNIEKIDEVEEWKQIILNGTDSKVIVSSELLESIKKFIPNEINEKSWKIWTDKILEENIVKPKELFVTIRLLLTGKKFGPSMNELLTLLERKEIFKRIEDNSGK